MNKKVRLKFGLLACLLAVSSAASSWAYVYPAEAATVRSIVYPVIGPSSYVNDFYATRNLNGRTVRHNATDIMAKKGQALVAAVSGTIVDVQYPQPRWGYSVTIRDSAGYEYSYLHMNDDNWGTNDGSGGGMKAYAVDVKEGNKVVSGQRLGWVGDSGYSNGIPHLHFEMYAPSGAVINPYYSLRQATKITSPRNYPELTQEILPSGVSFKSKASIALGNFDEDINPEIVTAPGLGGKRVKVYDTNKVKIANFAPNSSGFSGGYDVAAGNVDGDPEDEIITGAGKGGGPRVSIFDLDGTLLNTFYAYATSFKGGIDVASGDVTGTEVAEIVTGAGPTATSKVAVWQPDGLRLRQFTAYSSTFTGGVKVGVGNIRLDTQKAEILTVPSTKAAPLIKMYSGTTGTHLRSYYFMEQWWKGYQDIGVTDGYSMAITGVNRRDSVRLGIN